MVKIGISKQRFFNNGQLILKGLTDKAGDPLETKIHEWLERDLDLPDKSRKKGTGMMQKF